MKSDILTTIYSQHTAFLQRVAATQGRAIVPYLENIQNDIQRIFNKYRDRNKTARNQSAITEAINASARENLQLYIAELRKNHRELGGDESEFSAGALNNATDSDLETKIPTAAQVNALAIATPIQVGEKSYTTYKKMLSNYWQKWAGEIDAQVQAGFFSGQTINEIADNVYNEIRLQPGNLSKNVLNRAKRSAKSVAITGTNHYANTARLEFVDQNDDMIKGYRLISVLDSRTSQQCRALDQRFIPKDSSKLKSLKPPLHINCRTALVYELDDKFKLDDEDTKRASSFEVDGKRDPKPVSSEGIYYDKMSDLKAKDQDEILGPTLGKAFREMDSPSEFAKATIDTLGNPLTIEQMREKDGKLGDILKRIEREKKKARKANTKQSGG